MVSPFPIIAAAWTFFRKQPVLTSIVLWLGIVPLALADIVVPWIEPADPAFNLALQISVLIVLTFLSTWSTAASLLTGRRMIQNRAGRSRTSLRAITTEAIPVIIPLLLTFLLRGCFALYRTLLFVIPAIAVILTPGLCGDLPVSPASFASLLRTILLCPFLLILLPLLIPAFVYLIRTVFYQIALIADDAPYRAAFRRSADLVRGRFWHVFGTILLLLLLLILPAQLIALLLDLFATNTGPLIRAVSITLSYSLTQFSSLLFLLSLIAYYGELRTKGFVLGGEMNIINKASNDAAL